MNPAVLGNLTALAQKQQQQTLQIQQAQQMALNASNAAAAAVSAGPGGVPIQIRGAGFLISIGAAAAWRTTQLGPFVPQAATWVLLSGYAYFSTPDNADVELDFRSDLSGATICACRYRSVNGTYSGNAAINVWVPVGQGHTIQYQVINGSYSALLITPVAYF